MKYILKNKIPIQCDDIKEWGEWFNDVDKRRVDRTEINQDIYVSTVFLGLDHNFDGGLPILFETMIFGGEHDDTMWRCSTWDEAIQQHKDAVKLAQV